MRRAIGLKSDDGRSKSIGRIDIGASTCPHVSTRDSSSLCVYSPCLDFLWGNVELERFSFWRNPMLRKPCAIPDLVSQDDLTLNLTEVSILLRESIMKSIRPFVHRVKVISV